MESKRQLGKCATDDSLPSTVVVGARSDDELSHADDAPECNQEYELSKAKPVVRLATSRNQSFDLEAELEEDVAVKLKKANKRMKGIYLSKPYNVLTFAQVNKRQLDNTPTRVYSVYRAD